MNPTVVLTLILLVLMAAAGIFSGKWGYTLGREALRGVSQPDSRPNAQLNGQTPNENSHPSEMVLMNEAEIIEDVKSRMAGQAPPSSEPTPSPSPSPESNEPSAMNDEQDPAQTDELLSDAERGTSPVPSPSEESGEDSGVWEGTEQEQILTEPDSEPLGRDNHDSSDVEAFNAADDIFSSTSLDDNTLDPFIQSDPFAEDNGFSEDLGTDFVPSQENAE